jgi:hypothetical protein
MKLLPITSGAVGILVILASPLAAQHDIHRNVIHTVAIGNEHVQRRLQLSNGTWRTVEISRADGTDALKVDSDEFHVLFFDGETVTVDDYESTEEPRLATEGLLQKLVVKYVRRQDASTPKGAPTGVTITYSAGEGFFMRKTVELVMPEAFRKQIDRLEVERFSTPIKAARGGRGQPVFLGDKWFVGIEHPSARSRHTDGNTPADNAEYGKDQWGKWLCWLYNHSAEKRDVEKEPREGLVRLMHFPPYPQLAADGNYCLKSKTAVVGTHAPGDTLELGFMSYMKTISLKPKRLSHYNNWYDGKNKDLRIPHFVDNVLANYNRYFSKYGVSVDSMVPDNFNWHVNSSFYQPNPRYFPNGDKDMRELNDALKEDGSCLGLWLTLSGNNGMSGKWAKENGYQWGPGGHFLLSNPKNKAAMKRRLKELLVDVGVNYFKHDFNTLSSKAENGHPPTARHGHEAEVDAMFELLEWEVECNPDVFINITSGSWFSPWLLAKCHSIWMLSHDGGAGLSGPEPSNFSHQQSYRDEVIYPAWGNPFSRPLVPVSQLMTHGIICAPHCLSRGYNNIKEDSIQGWASGVMMYYMRGTLLQEWYITPDDLTQEQWDALGRTSRWFKENQSILINSVFWGGDPTEGHPYGYAAWNGDRGIISMRNSLPTPQEVAIPFDKTVWYGGKQGVTYKAEVVFPWHNEWPETFVSGKPIEITIPPYTVMAMHLRPGRPKQPSPALVDSVPVRCEQKKVKGVLEEASFTVPSTKMKNCELMVTVYSPQFPEIEINGVRQRHVRSSWSTFWNGRTDKWRTRCFDLLPFQGKEVTLRIINDPVYGRALLCDLYMIQYQAVEEKPGSDDVRLPLPVSQGVRRAVEVLYEKMPIAEARPLSAHPLFGRWNYEAGGHPYSREFTKDGLCVLRQGDRVTWKKECSVLNETDIQVAADAVHSYKTPLLEFPSTGAWTTWRTVSKAVTLQKGENTIKLLASGKSGGLLDYLKVVPPGAADGRKYEAEDARLVGVKTETAYKGHSGKAAVDYIAASGDFIEWTVQVPEAGTYTLVFGYSLGANDRPLGLLVNSQADAYMEVGKGKYRATRARNENAVPVDNDTAATRARLKEMMPGTTEILFVKRYTFQSSHYYTDHIDGCRRFGGNICVLSLQDGSVRDLLSGEMAEGIVGRCDLSYDGTRIVFGWKRKYGEGFRIWEVFLDGTGLRQLTFPPDDEGERIAKHRHPGNNRYTWHTDDMHPCYLPDGGICFVSTRCEHVILCGITPKYTTTVLYRMDGDGGNMEKLSNNSVSEATPGIMSDGRILYTRWEYIDKGQVASKGLWAMKSDGTASEEIYGANIAFPSVFYAGRPAPGGNNKFVAVGTPHMPLGVGTLMLIDSKLNRRTGEPVTYLTPEIDNCHQIGWDRLPGGATKPIPPEDQAGRDGGGNVRAGPFYMDPYPLTEKQVLMSMNPDQRWNALNAYNLYLYDNGIRRLLYDDDETSCWMPIPVRARKTPPITRTACDPELAGNKLARVIVTDVHEGLDGVPRGTVRYLRINEHVPRPWLNRLFSLPFKTLVSVDAHLGLKVQHGIVPVEKDGSAHFLVKADRNIFLQALDENFVEVQRERTFVNYRPGETRGCVGCHETGNTPTNKRFPLAVSRQPSMPGPQPGEESGERTISYAVDVQPVWDKHCVKCHGGEKTEGALDLSGKLTGRFNISYQNIMKRRLIAYIGEGRPKAGNAHYLPPYSVGAHASKLSKYIRKSHHNVSLSMEEQIRVTTWMDSNGQYHGSYWGRHEIKDKEHPNFRREATFAEAVSLVPPLPEKER